MSTPTPVRKDGKFHLTCPDCGISHSDTTPAALLRWWKAHRTTGWHSSRRSVIFHARPPAVW